MRLLDTKTGQFVDHNPLSRIYAILSHVWKPDGEQTYQELQDIQRSYGPDGRPRALSPAPSLASSATTVTPRSSLTKHQPPQPPSIWYDPRLSPKIRRACETARKDGFWYIWIDSCCIDKTSSSELSESINSMYAWYRDAKICYAYLADVSPGPSLGEQFPRSRWFTRGWTLQELIAPLNVVFLNKEWTSFGTKHSMAEIIEHITGIGQDVLKHEVSLDQVSIAKRMSWASKRHTTRLEDEAYSLLGIFHIHMPLLYGEGRAAFRRLQEELSRRIPDQSLFAWGNAAGTAGPVHATFLLNASSRILNTDPNRANTSAEEEEEDLPSLLSAAQPIALVETSSLFAASPHEFHSSSHVNPILDHDVFSSLLGGINVPVLDYGPSPWGIRTHFPLLHLANSSDVHPEDHSWYIAILACTDEEDGDLHLLGRLCVSPAFNDHTDTVHIFHSTTVQISGVGQPCGLFALPNLQELANGGFLRHIHTRTVFLPHPDREAPARHDLDLPPPGRKDKKGDRVQILYPKWARDSLRAQGYCVEVQPRTNLKHDHKCPSLRIALSKGTHTIHLVCRYLSPTQSGPRRTSGHRPGPRFIAIIVYYLPSTPGDVDQPGVYMPSGESSTTPALGDVPYRHIMTLSPASGQRSCSDSVSLPLAGGGEVVLRVALELVSPTCYHLRIALDDTPARPPYLQDASGGRDPNIGA